MSEPYVTTTDTTENGLNVEVRIHLKWWFKYLYIPGLAATMRIADFFGYDAQPDPVKMARIFVRGQRITMLVDGEVVARV